MKHIRPKGLFETRVHIENEQTEMTFDLYYSSLLENTVMLCLQYENIVVGCEVNLLIMDDAAIRQINREFREVDRSTDVLSFPLVHMGNGRILSQEGDYDLDAGLLLLGDIVISMETAQRQAEQYGHSLERELAFLTSHGIFHLLGYDHKEKAEETVMLSKQEKVLETLGLKRR